MASAKELLQKAADGGKISGKEAEKLVAAGVSASRIERYAGNNDVNLGSAAQRVVSAPPAPSAPAPSSGGTYYTTSNSNSGVRTTTYYPPGTSPASVQPSSPGPTGSPYEELASREAAAKSALEQYDQRFSELTSQYNTALQERNSFQSQVSAAQTAAQEAKNRADAYEKQQKEQQEFAINEQLRGLRSGTTVSGTPGAGLGSLSSGGRSYSSGGTSRPGGILDSYYRSGDLTDSVLDRRGPVVEPVQMQSGGTSAPRSLTGGASNSAGYYARRFG